MKTTTIYTFLALLGLLLLTRCTTTHIPDPDSELMDGNVMQDSPIETLWSAWLSQDTSYFFSNGPSFLYKNKFVFVANIGGVEGEKTLFAYDRQSGEMLDSIPIPYEGSVDDSFLEGNRLILNHNKLVLQCFDLDVVEEVWVYRKQGYTLSYCKSIQDGHYYQSIYPNNPSTTNPAETVAIDIATGKSEVLYRHYPNAGEHEVLLGAPLMETDENGHRISYYSLARCKDARCQVDLVAHDLNTDKILWKIIGDPLDGYGTFAPINSGNNLLALDNDTLSLIEKQTGKILSREGVPGALYFAYPLVVDGYAYYKPLQPSLTKVNIRTGKVVWSYTDKGKSAGSFPPRFLRMGNGLIYITSGIETRMSIFDQDGNNLYRIEAPFISYDNLTKTFPRFGYSYVAIDEAEGTFYYMDGWKMHRCKLF